jgi:N-acetylneuraminic acid mutarotase
VAPGPPGYLCRHALLGGRIHLLGGVAPEGDTNEHDVFDPAAGRWIPAAPIPGSRDHAAAAVVGGLLHVAGGRPGGRTTHLVYDPVTDRWQTLPPLPSGRSSMAGAALPGRFVVIGGEDAAETTVTARVDVYDVATARWARLPDLPTALQGIGVVTVGGVVVVPGGAPSAGGGQQSDRLLTLP